ncbi:hypothetical protein TNCV_335361 [Trichonephila clavipes]|nr:hypothetical protein TNCV_335361 [Trichonephila clavipes]
MVTRRCEQDYEIGDSFGKKKDVTKKGMIEKSVKSALLENFMRISNGSLRQRSSQLSFEFVCALSVIRQRNFIYLSSCWNCYRELFPDSCKSL